MGYKKPIVVRGKEEPDPRYEEQTKEAIERIEKLIEERKKTNGPSWIERKLKEWKKNAQRKSENQE